MKKKRKNHGLETPPSNQTSCVKGSASDPSKIILNLQTLTYLCSIECWDVKK